MGRRIPGVLFAVAVALAGAGVWVAVVRLTADDGPPSDPRRVAVEALARRPQDVAGSVRYLVRDILEDPDMRVEMATYEGSADFQRQRFLARGGFIPQDGPTEVADVFVFGQWQYVRSGEDARWRRGFLQPQSVGAPTPELTIVGRRVDHLLAPAYAGDLEVRRQIVDALVADVVLVGREEQHGTPTWHYRVTVDDGRAANRLPEGVRQEMEAWEEGQVRRDLDLWLDARGRLRKLSIFYPVEEGRGFRVENEFWDFDEPGRIDLPADLGDPSAIGGEGVTSFTAPGVELDSESPGFAPWVFGPDGPGDDLDLLVDDRPRPGADSRRRFFRIRPAESRHLELGDLRIVGVQEYNDGAPLAVDLSTPEVDAVCPRDQPRSGTLTVLEAVRYEDGYYVRLHVRFVVTCRPPGNAAPVSVTGEARFHSLT